MPRPGVSLAGARQVSFTFRRLTLNAPTLLCVEIARPINSRYLAKLFTRRLANGKDRERREKKDGRARWEKDTSTRVQSRRQSTSRCALLKRCNSSMKRGLRRALKCSNLLTHLLRRWKCAFSLRSAPGDLECTGEEVLPSGGQKIRDAVASIGLRRSFSFTAESTGRRSSIAVRSA